jgi:hypothetical protein
MGQRDNQETRNISGRIVDTESGETLPFADVLIKGEKTGTSTNADGFFSLQGITTDTLWLQIMYVGYNTKEIFIEAGKENISAMKIELSSGVQLEEISVVASSFKVLKTTDGVSSVQLSPQKIALLPNVGEVDIFRSLQLLPGISGSNESSSGLYVRGGTPDQNLVILDGMTVYNVDHFFGFFSAFNASAIKDVQLFKGAFPAKYGGRLSSVVDLTGKIGNPKEFHGNFGINLLNAKANLQIPLFGKGSLTLSGRRSYTDIIQSGLYDSIFGVFDQADNSNAFLEANGIETTTIEPSFYFFDFNSKLSFRPTEKDNIAISLYTGKDNLEEADFLDIDREFGQIKRNITRDLQEYTNWGNRGLSGKWSRQWNDVWYSNVLVAYSNYFSKYDRNAQIQVRNPEVDSVTLDLKLSTFEDNDVQDLSFKINNELQLGKKHKVGFGLESTQAKVDYQLTRNDTLTILDEQQEARFTSLYLEDTWRPLDKLSLNIGLRGTHYDVNNQLYWSPRFSLEYQATDEIKLKTAFGKHYQFVNRVVNENVTEGSRDFWLLADEELIEVSSANHYVIGATYENEGFVFDLEAYRKNLNNLSEFSLRFQRDINDVSELFFSGEGISQGIEGLIQKKAGQYTGWISYTLAEVVHKFADLNEGNNFYALHDSRHEFKMVHTYDYGNWTFGLTWVFGSGKPYTEPESLYSLEFLDGSNASYINVGSKNAARLPAYHRMDISGHYKIKNKGVEYDFGLSVFNLYGRQNTWYREFDFSTNPPIISDVKYLGFTPNVSFEIKF